MPKGVLTLFRILGKAEEPTALAARRLRRDPAFVRSIAAFYVKQVLWTDNPDHYRLLGVASDAPQEQIVENLRAALAWLVPYAGTARWEGEFAAAVAVAGRAIGTEDERIAYDLATWSDLAAAPYTPPPRKTIWRAGAVGVASLAWIAVLSGNFLASGVVNAPTAARPMSAAAPSEADPSIAVVRVKVVKGEDSPAAVPTEEPQPASAQLAESAEPPATGAPIDLLGEAPAPEATASAAATPPDFETAFRRQDASDGDMASTAPAEDQSVVTAGLPPPNAAAASDETASITGEAASEPAPDAATATALVAEAAPTAEAAKVEPAQVAEAAPTPAAVSQAARREEAATVLALAEPARIEAAAAAAPPPVVVAPSFKCSKARTTVELAICGDAALAGKDRDLAQLYRQLRGSLPSSQRASETSRQIAWLKDRDSCGDSATCLGSAYDSRIQELTTRLE